MPKKATRNVSSKKLAASTNGNNGDGARNGKSKPTAREAKCGRRRGDNLRLRSKVPAIKVSLVAVSEATPTMRVLDELDEATRGDQDEALNGSADSFIEDAAVHPEFNLCLAASKIDEPRILPLDEEPYGLRGEDAENEELSSEGVDTGALEEGREGFEAHGCQEASGDTERLMIEAAQPEPHSRDHSSASASAVDASEAKAAELPRSHRDRRLPPAGTVLVKRDRRGNRVCECLVRENDVMYKGTSYPSLSAAATAAARELGQRGTVNGFVFFQIVKPNAKPMPLSERLRRIGERYEEQMAALLSIPDSSNVEEIKAAIALHLRKVKRMVEFHAQ